MSRNRINLILLVIFLCLGVYVYIQKEGNIRVPAARRVERIFTFNRDDIQEMMLRGKKEAIFFKKEKGQWRIKQPLDTPADNEKINDLLALFDYGIVGVMDTYPQDYSQYGLLQPEIEWSIKGAGGAAFRSLLIGSNNPNNTGCYARVKGESRVMLIGLLYKSELQKEALYFRSQQ